MQDSQQKVRYLKVAYGGNGVVFLSVDFNFIYHEVMSGV
jgi:hypothetical protein